MKFLIIGLGSMGKRRIRNLQTLKAGEIIGFDPKEKCRNESEHNYKIKTVADISSVDLGSIDSLIISTPPDHHNEWIKFAIKHKKPAFVEASVILDELPKLKKQAEKAKVLIVPSATFRFHPAIKIIREIVTGERYGKIVNWSYHLGQYLPDWHPWEKVGDSYTGKKETNGAREMVAFELTWLLEIAGWPDDIAGFYGRTMDFGVDIDDTYAISLKFKNAFGALMIDTTARYATKKLIMNLEHAQILWSWDENVVNLYDAETQKWKKILLSAGQTALGYNPNIREDIYVDEMKAFLKAVNGVAEFPNSMERDIKILKLLHKIEGKYC